MIWETSSRKPHHPITKGSHTRRGLVKSMLTSMLVNKDFLTWLLIGWRLCCQPIRCHVWTYLLTYWGRVTHICVGKTTIIGSENGLSPGRRQAIIWTNAGILLIGPLGTNFSEILIGIQTSSFKKMHLKMSSGKWRPSCLGLNVLTNMDFNMDIS